MKSMKNNEVGKTFRTTQTEVRIKKNLKPLFEREKYWYVSNTPRRCTNCGKRIKIGMTYYIPPGAGVLCSDCGQEHLEIRKKGKI